MLDATKQGPIQVPVLATTSNSRPEQSASKGAHSVVHMLLNSILLRIESNVSTASPCMYVNGQPQTNFKWHSPDVAPVSLRQAFHVSTHTCKRQIAVTIAPPNVVIHRRIHVYAFYQSLLSHSEICRTSTQSCAASAPSKKATSFIDMVVL